MLELKYIEKSFDGVQVLKNLSLQVDDGEIYIAFQVIIHIHMKALGITVRAQ